MEILGKATVSPELPAEKLCGNCPLLQNFHTSKLGKFTVFYAVVTPFSDNAIYHLMAFQNCFDNRKTWIFS